LSLLSSTCKIFTEAGTQESLWRVIGVMAPPQALSGLRRVDRLTTGLKVNTLTRKSEFFWQLFGIVVGLQYYKSTLLASNPSIEDSNIENVQSEAELTWPLFDDSIYSYYNSIPLRVWQNLNYEVDQVSVSLLKKTLKNLDELAMDFNPITTSFLNYIRGVVGPSKSLLESWSELWILFARPYIRAQTKIEDVIIDILRVYDQKGILLPGQSVPLALFYDKKYNISLGGLDNKLFLELILLRRGPRLLLSKDKGLLSATKIIVPSIYDGSEHFVLTNICKAAIGMGILPNVSIKGLSNTKGVKAMNTDFGQFKINLENRSKIHNKGPKSTKKRKSK
jgi:hypothetical protein